VQHGAVWTPGGQESRFDALSTLHTLIPGSGTPAVLQSPVYASRGADWRESQNWGEVHVQARKKLLAVRNSPFPNLAGKWAHLRVLARNMCAEKLSVPLHICPSLPEIAWKCTKTHGIEASMGLLQVNQRTYSLVCHAVSQYPAGCHFYLGDSIFKFDRSGVFPPQPPHNTGAPPAQPLQIHLKAGCHLWRIRCGGRQWGRSPCLAESGSLPHWISWFKPAAASPEPSICFFLPRSARWQSTTRHRTEASRNAHLNQLST